MCDQCYDRKNYVFMLISHIKNTTFVKVQNNFAFYLYIEMSFRVIKNNKVIHKKLINKIRCNCIESFRKVFLR